MSGPVFGKPAHGAENVIGAATLIMAAALVMAPFASLIWFQLIVAAAAGGAWVARLSTLNMAMQMRAPDAILGRCLAIYQALAFGASIWLSFPSSMRFLAPMPARGESRVIP